MLALQRLWVSICLLLLTCNAVLAFEMSVPSLKVAIGQKFAVSWTSTSTDPQTVDICLNTDTEFIPVGSIQRSDLLQGAVNITLDDTIFPTTYTLGIRFPGCSYAIDTFAASHRLLTHPIGSCSLPSSMTSLLFHRRVGPSPRDKLPASPRSALSFTMIHIGYEVFISRGFMLTPGNRSKGWRGRKNGCTQ
ncbi:hypothetical protein FPV67DRAFT_1770 [Lyophyllum atratum]|nr:hypothetical protein FPV67DRAFT_1770 [Lyophyllum atratum]